MMDYINIYGLIFMVLILIPNIVFAVRRKDGFISLWKNRWVEVPEMIGRLGSFIFMIILLPWFPFGFKSKGLFFLYLLIDLILTLVYCILWIILFRKNTVFRSLSLSIIPSLIFLSSGILSGYIPLLVSALIFAPCHITISYKNAVLAK
jgi:hypothetical protein